MGDRGWGLGESFYQPPTLNPYPLFNSFKRPLLIYEFKVKARYSVSPYAAPAHRSDDRDSILRARHAHKAPARDVERCENGRAAPTDVLRHSCFSVCDLSLLVQHLYDHFDWYIVARLGARLLR